MSLTKKFNLSIRSRLLLIALAPAIYLLSSLLISGYYARNETIQQELESRANTLATALTNGIQPKILAGNEKEIADFFESILSTDEDIESITLLDNQKHIIASKHANMSQAHPTVNATQAVKKKIAWIYRSTDTHNENNIHHSISPQIKEITEAYIQVSMHTTHKHNHLKKQFALEVFMALVTLSIVIWMINWLSHSITQPMHDVMQAVRHIQEGRTQTQINMQQSEATGELAELQEHINHMAQSLHQYQHHLEQQVRERTASLTIANNEKRQLLHKMNTVSEEEKQSIAVEIHDELNASLIAIKLQAEQITKQAQAIQAEKIATQAEHIKTVANQLYTNGRKLVQRLRPEVLEMMGIKIAIEELIQHFNQTQQNLEHGCQFQFKAINDSDELDETAYHNIPHDRALSIYRIIQESCSNVIKHAHATKAQIQFTLTNESVFLHIQDNGKGIEEKILNHLKSMHIGIGLSGIKERIAMLQGDIHIHSTPQQGFEIKMRIPLDNQNASTNSQLSTAQRLN